MDRDCFQNKAILMVILFGLMLFAGCSGNDKTADGGIGGTGVTNGPISGFGSVHVNGVRLDTSKTRFTFEGNPGSEDQLVQGMVITATADTVQPGSRGTASTIDFRFNLIGAIDPVDPNNKDQKITDFLQAVGQDILLDDMTVLRNVSSPSELHVDDIIAVSGYRNAKGQILATYLEKLGTGKADTLSATVVEGKVDSIDYSAFTFNIGKQVVDWSSAQLINFPNGLPEKGQIVRVKGREDANRLMASRINNQAGLLSNSEIKSASISGLVSTVQSWNEFVLNDTPVKLTDATVLTNGTYMDIVANSMLLARGTRDKAGKLIADEIIFINQPNIRVEAPVQAVDPVRGTVTLAGLTAIVNNFTLMQDHSSANLVVFSLNDIGVGDSLRLTGYEHGTRTVIVSRLERLSIGGGGDVALISGHVGQTINNPVFYIAGLPIDTTELQDFTGFYENDSHAISRNEFFRSLQPGDRVDAYGLPQSDLFRATKAVLENFSNLTVLNPGGGVTGGTNDVTAAWDGSMNTQADIDNHTLRENMTINTPTPFFQFSMTFHDVHVFGPGSYTFNTCNPGVPPSQCGYLNMTVGPKQLGAHMLMDWSQSTDNDIVMVWDLNGSFPPDMLYRGPIGPTPNPDAVWNLVSVDADGDGVPGIAMVDGPFSGFSWNLNLNIPALPVGLDVKPKQLIKRISQSSADAVPVAIISRDAIDATRVDPGSIAATDPTGRLQGSSKTMCRKQDVNQDRKMDLVCEIEMQRLEGPPGSRVFQLKADTFEGFHLRGEDSVVVVP